MSNWVTRYESGRLVITHSEYKNTSINLYQGMYYLDFSDTSVFTDGCFPEQILIGYEYEDLSVILREADEKIASICRSLEKTPQNFLDSLLEIVEKLEIAYPFDYVVKRIEDSVKESGKLPSVYDLGIVDKNGLLLEDFRNDVLYGDGVSLVILRKLKEVYPEIETDVANTLDRVTLVEPILGISSVPSIVEEKVFENSEFREYIGHIIMTATLETDVWIYILNSDYGDYVSVVDHIAGTETSFRVTQEIIDTIIEFYGVDISPLLQSPVSILESFDASQQDTQQSEHESSDEVEEIIEEVDSDVEKELAVIEEQIEKIESLPDDIRDNDRIMEIYYLLLGKQQYIQKQHDDKKSQEIVDNIIDEISTELGDLDNVFLDDDRNEIVVNEGKSFKYGDVSIKPIVTGFRNKKSKVLIVEKQGSVERIDLRGKKLRSVLESVLDVEVPQVADIATAYMVIQAVENDKDSANSFYNSLVNIAYRLDGYATPSDYKKFIKNVVDDGDYEDKTDTLPYLVNVASQDVKRFNSVINRMKLRLGLD